MNKKILTLFLIILLLSSVGCGTTNDKSYRDALRRSFSDDADELEYDEDIEYELYRRNWVVRIEQKPRLADMIMRMVAKKGTIPNIQVIEGYYTFTSNQNWSCSLSIVTDCLVDGEPRWLYIDCGTAYVESKYLKTDRKWYLSLQDKEENNVEEPWAWCYYDKGEIDDDFWKPYITYASKNYMYMSSGIYLKSY